MIKGKLTTEFKRKRVFRYCLTHPDCNGCPLRIGGWDVQILMTNPDEACLVIAGATPRDIDRAYELVKDALAKEEVK